MVRVDGRWQEKTDTCLQFVGANGGLGVCYETGLYDDLGPLEDVKMEIKRLLRGEVGVDLGGDEVEASADDEKREWEEFVIEEAVMWEEGFEFAEGMGKANFQLVPAGTAIDERGLVKREHETFLVFPKVKELFVAGKPCVWLCRKNKRGEDKKTK